MDSAILTSQDLTCCRGEQQLFANLNFTVAAGQALHITGANGSGKSSLLAVLCGLLLPTTGKILWRGQELSQCRVTYLAELQFVGHRLGIKSGLTVRENLQFFALLQCHEVQVLAQVAEQVGLASKLDVPVDELSFGQKRRLALARLLLVPAKLWVLDEPFNGLDATAYAQWQQVVTTHLQQGGLVIFTSHQVVNHATWSLQRLNLT
jgi:heme exporter protein A